jgi:predicted HD superfamily hydrolase involved in NAD metabolism
MMIDDLVKEINRYLEEQFLHDQARLKHILNVTEVALVLGEIFGVDKDKIKVASLLHDATKKLTFQENYALARIIFDEEFINEIPKSCLHAFSAAALAKVKFKVEDAEIISAIAYHCTGRSEMSVLEKLIYVADYIEESRKFVDSDIKEYARKDLDKSVYLIMKETENYLLKHNHPLAKITEKAIEAYESHKEELND